MKQSTVTIILLFLLLAYACKTNNSSYRNKKNTKISNDSAQNNSENFLFFLNFTIKSENSNTNSVIELLDKKVQKGSFKSQKNDTFENMLIFDLYENNILIKSYSIEHPLYKNVEFVDDNNNLKTKSIKLTTAEFFIRMQTNHQKNSLKIFEKMSKNEKLLIKTLTL